jgi:hypothetical protein
MSQRPVRRKVLRPPTEETIPRVELFLLAFAVCFGFGFLMLHMPPPRFVAYVKLIKQFFGQ